MAPAAPTVPGELLTELRAANAAVAAWLNMRSEASWGELRARLTAMDALAPCCAARRSDAAMGREVDRYYRQLQALSAQLSARQAELLARRAQLRQAQSKLVQLRAWKESLQNTTPQGLPR